MQGLKPGQINALERLYKRRFPKESVYSHEQARELALLSRAINRQIGLLIDRKGKVRMVIAGDAGSIYIPELPHFAPGGHKLRGWRLLHTHLGADPLSKEDLMDLLFLRLDAAIALTVNELGEPAQWQGAWFVTMSQSGSSNAPYFVDCLRPWHAAQCDFVALAEEYERGFTGVGSATKTATALLVSVSPEPRDIQERNLDELADLAATAGVEVGGRLSQRVERPNPKFILGKGKLAELEIMALNADAEILIFDGELAPAQLHNLADVTERKVLDRTQLILDIFAQHAVSRAGKLQVELAQLAYAQPRLAGGKKNMDRLMGGIGGRGPGESKLETDRRKSRERMAFLKRELGKLRQQRQFTRARRSRNGIPVVAMVGYTNAGKSTLLNKLTASHVPTANKLFATLDPAIRRLRFPREREITISDTVGFIRNLPRELMESFRATLEELESADLLLHVLDASKDDARAQLDAIEKTLEDLDLASKPRILVLNKCDRLRLPEIDSLRKAFPAAVAVSASDGAGLADLLARIERELFMGKASATKDCPKATPGAENGQTQGCSGDYQ